MGSVSQSTLLAFATGSNAQSRLKYLCHFPVGLRGLFVPRLKFGAIPPFECVNGLGMFCCIEIQVVHLLFKIALRYCPLIVFPVALKFFSVVRWLKIVGRQSTCV